MRIISVLQYTNCIIIIIIIIIIAFGNLKTAAIRR